mgnify:FL=1
MTETITCKKCGDKAQHYARGKCHRCWRADYNRQWMRDKRKRQKEEAAKS